MVIIPSEVIKQLDWKPDIELSISSTNRSIILKPAETNEKPIPIMTKVKGKRIPSLERVSH